MYVVIGAEHCRRQLSQWQFTQVWTGVSISNLMAPHKQRPRIIDLLGNILSFKVRAFRVAAKYALKVNTGDNYDLERRREVRAQFIQENVAFAKSRSSRLRIDLRSIADRRWHADQRDWGHGERTMYGQLALPSA